MHKQRYKYRLRLFTITSLVWELVFWFLAWQILNIFEVFNNTATGERLSFLYPKYVWLNLGVIPITFAFFYYQLIRRNRLVKTLGTSKTVDTFLKPISTNRIFFRYFLIRNILVFAIFALMQPALGSKKIHGSANGVDLVFAVDISNSMNTRDISNGDSRLTVAKRIMNELINQSSTARVGLLIFAGNSYPQLPLTSDIEAAKMFIDELNTGLISNQGTHVASALTGSAKLFTMKDTKKVLVLITDGEDHEGGMKPAYQTVKDNQIESYVIGVGTERGGIVPRSEHKNAQPLKDDLGRAVNSKVNKKLLQEMAGELNGKYMLTNDPFPNLSEFLTQINSKSGTNTVNLEFEVKENRYQWPLAISLMLLFILFIWESMPQLKKE